MRPLFLVPTLALLACTPQGVARLPPGDSFYYPTGVVYVPAPGSEGFLYVSSSNFDRRFDYGSLTAVDLSKLGLPAFGTRPADPAQVPAFFDLKIGASAQVLTQGFTGEMLAVDLGGGGAVPSRRIFTPSRAEGNFLHVVDAIGDVLSCHFPGPTNRDCSAGSPSLTALEGVGTGKPRAPQPFGLGLWQDPSDANHSELWVTHLQGADSPVGSAQNIEAFTVQLDPRRETADPAAFITSDDFISLGTGATNSVAVGQRYAYLTGRYFSPQGYLLRLQDRTRKVPLLNPALENIYKALEARGIAVDSDGSGTERLYIAARSPDSLLVVDVLGANSDFPVTTLVRALPLPAGSSEVKLIKRPGAGRGNLVVITNNIANAVSIYDDELGQLVAQVSDAGSQPFGVAAQLENGGAGVRFFVTTFGDGRIAVIDMPSLDTPQNVFVVARLGVPQFCLLDQTNPACANSQASP